MTKNGQADRLQRVRDFLDRLTDADEELKKELATVEINSVRIAEGEALYDATEKAITHQNTTHAKLLKIQRERRTKRQQRSKLYEKQWERAAEDITDPFVRDLLRLDTKPATRINKRHLEMRQFYTTALEHPELHETLSTTGLTVQAMQAGLTSLNEIERLTAQVSTAKLASLAATKAQTAAFDAVEAWHSARMIESTYATREKPHLMKALGRKMRGVE